MYCSCKIIILFKCLTWSMTKYSVFKGQILTEEVQVCSNAKYISISISITVTVYNVYVLCMYSCEIYGVCLAVFTEIQYIGFCLAALTWTSLKLPAFNDVTLTFKYTAGIRTPAPGLKRMMKLDFYMMVDNPVYTVINWIIRNKCICCSNQYNWSVVCLISCSFRAMK